MLQRAAVPNRYSAGIWAVGRDGSKGKNQEQRPQREFLSPGSPRSTNLSHSQKSLIKCATYANLYRHGEARAIFRTLPANLVSPTKLCDGVHP
eukprot:2658159-Rhodomonas_salina.2